MFDYVVSLREGIMDAWGGIVGALTSSQKSKFAVACLKYSIAGHLTSF